MLIFLILICLLSPALSIVGIFNFPYFPNEKIGFMLVLLNLLFKKQTFRSDLMIAGFAASSIFASIVAIRLLRGGDMNVTDINMIYLFSALIFYLTYFRLEFHKVVDALPGLVFLQLLVSIIQQMAMQLDMSSLASIFNNYPPQLDYQYGTTDLGFFRTSGLFNESSQYATFLVFFVITYQEGLIKKTNFSRFLLFTSIVEVMINQSITAFLIITLYLIYKYYSAANKKLDKTALFLVPTFICILIFSDVFKKINYTLIADDASFPRLLFAYQRIEQTVYENIFTGNGLHWNTPSWDIVSVYFSGYGLIGLVTTLCFVIFVIQRTSVALAIPFLLFLMTNGNLLGSLNIFFISFLYAQKYKNVCVPHVYLNPAK